jgi:hypothetical protein
VLTVLPDARYDEDARLLAWPPQPPEPTGGLVAVVAAGCGYHINLRRTHARSAHGGRGRPYRAGNDGVDRLLDPGQAGAGVEQGGQQHVTGYARGNVYPNRATVHGHSSLLGSMVVSLARYCRGISVARPV